MSPASLPWAAVYHMHAIGMTLPEIELSLLRGGRFQSAGEARAFVNSIDAADRAGHLQLRQAVRKAVRTSVWNIMLGSVILAGVLVVVGGLEGNVAFTIAFLPWVSSPAVP